MNIGLYENNLKNTLTVIKNFSLKYCNDVYNYKQYTIKQFFDFVKNIPYVADPPGFEFVMRPKVMLNRRGGDCDDKTVLCCAFFTLKNITNGFAIVSQTYKPFHHIFPFFCDDKGTKFDYDCTYKHSKYLETKKWCQRKDFIIYHKKRI